MKREQELKKKVVESLRRTCPFKDLADQVGKEISTVVELANGMLVVIEKQSIKKDFCFGHGSFGMTYDEACRAERAAGESTEYFVRENMRDYEKMLECVSSNWDESQYGFYLTVSRFDESLAYIHPCRLTEIVDAYGGSVWLDSIKGDHITINYVPAYIPTDEDREAIRSGVVVAMETHKKKIETYLKRYGLSKIRTWTYWQDE